MKIKKGIPLIDQHDKNFMYGGKFGGNYIPETLKKPIDDLTKLFSNLRKNKKFLKDRDYYFENYVGAPTPFIKLENFSSNVLTNGPFVEIQLLLIHSDKYFFSKSPILGTDKGIKFFLFIEFQHIKIFILI